MEALKKEDNDNLNKVMNKLYPSEEEKAVKMTKHDHLNKLVDDKIKQKWEDEQNEMKKYLVEEDKFDFDPSALDGSLKIVGAVDISYCKTDDRKAVAALIILEYPTFKILYEDYEPEEKTDFPYIPGFLAFKEIPVYKVLFQRLKNSNPDLWP